MKILPYIFIYSCLLSNIIVSPSDPMNIFIKQNFYSTHEIDLLLRPYPYKLDHIYKSDFLNVKEINYVRSLLKIKSGKLNEYLGAVWLTGSVGNKISYLLEPTIVNQSNSERLLGNNYSRLGIGGRITNALIRYSSNHTNIQFGRTPVWWGQSWNSALVHSKNAFPIDHISFRFSSGNIFIELLTGQLSSLRSESSERIRRNISGHRIVWINRKKNFVFSMGESVIYGGYNRPLEFHYLNPFIPFFFASIDEEEGGDIDLDDNFFIFFNSRYNLNNSTSLYGEYILDDYQMDSEINSTYPNAWCILLGLDGKVSLLKNEYYYNMEYIETSKWAYTHEEITNNWQNLNAPIGYKNGPDCKSINFNISNWILDKLLFNLFYEYVEKGAINILTQADQWGTKGVSSPSSPVVYSNKINTKFEYYLKSSIISVGLQGDINNKSMTAFISFQLINNFSWS